VKTIGRANRMRAVFASREQLVNVDLMAYVPDKFVLRGIEDMVQRETQLDDAEVWPQVTAIFGKYRDQFVPDLLGQLTELSQRQFLNVFRFVHQFQITTHSFSLQC